MYIIYIDIDCNDFRLPGTQYIYIYEVTLQDKRNTVVDFTVLHFQFSDPL